MVVDPSLIAVAQLRASGADVHDVHGMCHTYRGCIELADQRRREGNTADAERWELEAALWAHGLALYGSGSTVKEAHAAVKVLRGGGKKTP
jgi:hypothetical protein